VDEPLCRQVGMLMNLHADRWGVDEPLCRQVGMRMNLRVDRWGCGRTSVRTCGEREKFVPVHVITLFVFFPGHSIGPDFKRSQQVHSRGG